MDFLGGEEKRGAFVKKKKRNVGRREFFLLK
jgi:hypothetical protein